MTGTSMDGVDLSLIKSDGYEEFHSILNNFYSFDLELQNKLISLRNQIFTNQDLKKYSHTIIEVEKEFTLFVGKILNNLLKNFDDHIDIIGFHGQTIFHDSDQKISNQLGDGKLLSQLVKKIVINNFRQKDLENDGNGAPLAPIFHKLISKSLNQKHKLPFPLSILNIGGIANLTQIFDDNISIDNNFHAFDIGPGNCLIDQWIRKNSEMKFDKNGEIAKSGKVDSLIFNQAIENFNILSYDKSLDIKDFDISFAKGLSLEDGCTTITKFSANLIANGIEYLNKLNNCFSKKILICGGGRKNKFLIDLISQKFVNDEIQFETIDKYGLDGDFIESQAFGYLSIRTFLKLPISFPSTTRCRYPSTGGDINKNY